MQNTYNHVEGQVCVSRKKDLDVNINFFKVNNGKGQNNVWNLFKFNSEGSRAKSITSFW